MTKNRLLAGALVLLGVCTCAGASGKGPRIGKAVPVTLPEGAGGIGFDDLRFAPELGVLVPAGRTGQVDLIDPATRKVTSIGGFSVIPKYKQGHGQSVTSVDVGGGWLFAVDRTAMTVVVVDPAKQTIVAQATLAGRPDYVRWVAPTRELWVTEPSDARIEVFSLPAEGVPTPKHEAEIAVIGGPESLVIDGKRGRAHTHMWHDKTVVIDLKTRKIVATWAAGCTDPRGIALDEARGFLMTGCEEGAATVLDVDHDGKLLGKVKAPAGVDIIAYDAGRRHLYVPGESSGGVAFVGVGEDGAAKLLGTGQAAEGAHCAATDGAGHAYVCDPKKGRILVLTDPF